MSLNRYAKRRDANEPEIVDALRAVGAKVMQLDEFDLLVKYQGQLYLIEVKTRIGKLTESQQKLLDDGWPLHIIRTVEAALSLIGVKS